MRMRKKFMENTNKELQCQIDNLEEKVKVLEDKCKSILMMMAFMDVIIIMCIINISQ